MVQSKINSTVNYPEINTLDLEDKEHDADLYEFNIKGVDCIIALGLPKFAFNEKDIVYYPVYIIKDERVYAQIGVYEITSTQQPAVLDEEGDVDISKLGPLLLYSYVDSKYLVDKSTPTPVQDESSSEEDEEGKEDEEESDESEEEDVTHSPLRSQDLKQAEIERAAYKKTKGESWIETFMHNKNYAIVDNEGGGDCFFAAIRDGLVRAGITTTVAELREKLAEEATENVFDGYRNFYEMNVGEIQNADRELKELSRQLKELTTRGKKNTKDRDILRQISDQAKTIKKKYDLVNIEKKQTKENAAEFAFMKGIDTLEKFKDIIKTCNFWGDTWAISTLERVMNVKLILFSRETFRGGDMDNVLQCGQLNDPVLQEVGNFKPDRYIILEFQGQHYTLITYKGRGAFTFIELPYDVKLKIVTKCLERNAGPFYIIKELRDFMESLNVPVPDQTQDEEEVVDADISSLGLISKTTVFQFYWKSANAPAPGKGSGETIRPEDVTQYAELRSIPEWRRKLSNFWEAPFELDGHRWSSVEHYYQASKFKENNPQFYLTFTLDANPEGELSKYPELAKAAGGKTGKYKGKQVRDKAIKIDPNFFGGRHKEEMKKAQMAKFTQNTDLKAMLLATNDAKLHHFSRGSPPVVFYELMAVRHEITEN